jgi:hypothetical protein
VQSLSLRHATHWFVVWLQRGVEPSPHSPSVVQTRPASGPPELLDDEPAPDEEPLPDPPPDEEPLEELDPVLPDASDLLSGCASAAPLDPEPPPVIVASIPPSNADPVSDPDAVPLPDPEPPPPLLPAPAASSPASSAGGGRRLSRPST